MSNLLRIPADVVLSIFQYHMSYPVFMVINAKKKSRHYPSPLLEKSFCRLDIIIDLDRFFALFDVIEVKKYINMYTNWFEGFCRYLIPSTYIIKKDECIRCCPDNKIFPSSARKVVPSRNKFYSAHGIFFADQYCKECAHKLIEIKTFHPVISQCKICNSHNLNNKGGCHICGNNNTPSGYFVRHWIKDQIHGVQVCDKCYDEWSQDVKKLK